MRYLEGYTRPEVLKPDFFGGEAGREDGIRKASGAPSHSAVHGSLLRRAAHTEPTSMSWAHAVGERVMVDPGGVLSSFKRMQKVM